MKNSNLNNIIHIKTGDVISHLQMSQLEGGMLQKGMNYRFKNKLSIFLMSTREGAPYNDQILENGTILVYEGHDQPSNLSKIPKLANQELSLPTGRPTENGKFYQAALNFKANQQKPEVIKIYEKIKKGIWVFNGLFDLVDAWREPEGNRYVYKFKLLLKADHEITSKTLAYTELPHNRLIPPEIKQVVWKRDKGRCVACGNETNLHFDHILPFSKGGTSLLVENIQLLCAKHNLQKSNKLI